VGRVAQSFAATTRLRVPHSFAYFANEWALRAPIPYKGLPGNRSISDLHRPLLKVNPNRTFFTVEICAITAPFPLLGLLDQSTLHRIVMHVEKFFDPLPLPVVTRPRTTAHQNVRFLTDKAHPFVFA
jgi:hypothetical protein